MDKKKDVGQELSEMLRNTPPRGILISFNDKPAKTLEEHVKAQQEQAKKKRRPRDSRER